MRIYLSVPIISNRDPARAALIAKAIADSGHEVTSPWVLGHSDEVASRSVNIFERDRSGVEASDAIVADVSVPSTGVGMEIMAAHYGGKKVVLLVKRGSVVSRMLTHMEPKRTVEFSDDSELYSGLAKVLAEF